jgi:hypothetical protein
LPRPISPADGAKPTDMRRGRAWIDEEIAIDVTGHLVSDAGHWVETPDYFCRMFIEFDTSARTRQPSRSSRKSSPVST